MPEQIVNYQCPACNGPLRYDGKLGLLVCDYCDSRYQTEEIVAYYAEKEAAALAASAGSRAKARKRARTEKEADTADNAGERKEAEKEADAADGVAQKGDTKSSGGINMPAGAAVSVDTDETGGTGTAGDIEVIADTSVPDDRDGTAGTGTAGDIEATADTSVHDRDDTADPGKKGGSWDSSATEAWGEAEADVIAYNCPSCGAELLCEATSAATSCPYCGNPSIIPGQFAGHLKPDYILPFKLDQAAAKRALKRFYQGKFLLPRSFSSENRIKELKGVYVPFWLFDGEASAAAAFEGVRSKVFVSGDYEITQTNHFRIKRSGRVSFQRIPVDASSRVPDEYMDAVEPFDYTELKAFSTGYLPGYLANKYDVSAQDCAAHADERAKNTALEALKADISGFDSLRLLSSSVDLERGQVHYALLPVYLLNTQWGGENYLFAMNGQTGRLVGKLPMSYRRYWSYFFKISILGALVFGSLLYFFT